MEREGTWQTTLPGPWHVVLDGQFIMDGDTYVAEILQRKVTPSEMAANAALIAAAPELVESAAIFLKWFRTFIGDAALQRNSRR